jgi:hypothetical protein
VVRALHKTGYHNSFNANAAYYTLPQTLGHSPRRPAQLPTTLKRLLGRPAGPAECGVV